MKAPPSADWAFGLIAGTLFGLAVAMIFIEPYWITPESKARTFVALAGIVGASLVTVARSRSAAREKAKNGDVST